MYIQPLENLGNVELQYYFNSLNYKRYTIFLTFHLNSINNNNKPCPTNWSQVDYIDQLSP